MVCSAEKSFFTRSVVVSGGAEAGGADSSRVVSLRVEFGSYWYPSHLRPVEVHRVPDRLSQLSVSVVVRLGYRIYKLVLFRRT